MLALERVTGRSLFSRGPTGYLLAKDGQALLDRVRLMQDAARAISDWRGEVLTLPIVSTAADSWTSRFIADHLASVWTPKDSFRMCYKTCDTGVDFTYREAHIAIGHSLSRRAATSPSAVRSRWRMRPIRRPVMTRRIATGSR